MAHVAVVIDRRAAYVYIHPPARYGLELLKLARERVVDLQHHLPHLFQDQGKLSAEGEN